MTTVNYTQWNGMCWHKRRNYFRRHEHEHLYHAIEIQMFNERVNMTDYDCSEFYQDKFN